MTKRFFGAAIALLIIGVAPAAYANNPHTPHNAHTAHNGGDNASCVDFNNNGSCDGADTPLNQVLQGNHGVVVTSKVARPADAPPTGPVGVVVGGGRLPGGWLVIVADGDVHVNNSIVTPNGGFVNITTSNGGDIDIAPGVSLKGGDIGVALNASGNVNIGDGAMITSNGGDGPSAVSISGNNISVGNNVKMDAAGYNAVLKVGANGALRVGTAASLTTHGPDEGPSRTVLSAHSDINLNNVHLQGRGVDVSALASSESPARHITISNSTVNILGTDGARFNLTADPGTNGQGSVTLSHDTITPPGSIESSPAAVIN